jgi:hypothetical protein
MSQGTWLADRFGPIDEDARRRWETLYLRDGIFSSPQPPAILPPPREKRCDAERRTAPREDISACATLPVAAE